MEFKSLEKNRSIQKKIGNPTEGALLKWISGKGYDYDSIRDNANIAKVVPFSTEIKRMETTITDGELFIKCAPEVVIGMCDTFNKISKDDAFSVLKEYQAKGMRTLAFAYKKEGGITLQAIVAISDPVRRDVAEAINICRSHAHVRVIMVTGDNAITAGDTHREAAIQTCYDRQQEEEFRRFCEMSWNTHFRPQINAVLEKMKQPSTDNTVVPKPKLMVARTPLIANGMDKKGTYDSLVHHWNGCQQELLSRNQTVLGRDFIPVQTKRHLQ